MSFYIYIYRDDVDSRVKISKEKEENGGGRNLCSITPGTVCSCSAVDFHYIQVHIKGPGQDLTHVFQIRNKGRGMKMTSLHTLQPHKPIRLYRLTLHGRASSHLTEHRFKHGWRSETFKDFKYINLYRRKQTVTHK